MLGARPPLTLLWAGFALCWIALAFGPHERSAWLLENVLTALLVGALFITRRRLPLSTTSHALIVGFLCLHSVGAHYTYSRVPYDAWLVALGGVSIDTLADLQRNHFDRAVHLAYGLVAVVPLRETLTSVVPGRIGRWLLPVDLVLSTSLVYELIEGAAAAAFGGDLGIAYVGAQGDVWDAHKDCALAGLGALLALAVIALRERRR